MGGFDGMKRNDMYRILIDPAAQQRALEQNNAREQEAAAAAQREEAKSSLEQPGEGTDFFSEDYFNNMTINQWCKVVPQGDSYSARTGHECIFHDDFIYLFGGTDDEDRKNDLY